MIHIKVYVIVIIIVIISLIMKTFSFSFSRRVFRNTFQIDSFIHNTRIQSRILYNRPSLIRNDKSKLFSTTSSTTASSSINDRKNLQLLLSEVIDIIITTGVTTSISRTIQVLRSVNKVTREFISNPSLYLDSSNNLSGPKVLRRLFEELGATYIKLGQFIASSPTIFPSEYVLEFQSCLDKTPSIPYYEIRKIIQNELTSKKPISSIFSYIDPVPLACASIAQVHKALLKETGKEVVLKVRKPGVDSTLKADLGFLYITVKLAELLNPSLSRISLVNIVGDIRQSMLDELDFRKEAQNLVNFRNFLERNDIMDAVAPEPILNLTSEKLLVMEYLKGVPLLDLEGIKKYSANPEATLITALRTWASSVVGNDIFHADVHGGNLLVLEDGRVGFIDFGIVGKISEKVWNAIGMLTESFAKSDYEGIAKALVTMGATNSEVDINKFASDIEQVFEKILNMQPTILLEQSPYGTSLDATIAINERETTELALQLVEVADKNGLKLPREFGLLMKQALYFDRYQKLLAPSLDPLRDARVKQSMLTETYEYKSSNKSRPGLTVDTELIEN